MKFKGFWKSTWELTKYSLRWFKDYWLLYTILYVIAMIFVSVWTIAHYFGWAEFKSLFSKKTTAEDEEFLK